MRPAAIIVGLLLVGCSGTRSSDDAEPAAKAEPTPEAATPEGFVVLRAGASLFRRPSAEAPSFVFDPRTTASFVDEFRAFEVIGHEGHWIRIRNLDAAEAKEHCVRGWEALEHFEIDLWVREGDVQRVTRRSAVAEFGDGTSVMLAAGTPVQRDGAQWIALGLGASARLPMRADAVAPFYRPGAMYEPKGSVDTLPRDTKLELGEHAIDTRLLLGTDAIATYERVRRDDGTLVTVGTRCAELKVLARGQTAPIEDVDAEIAARTAALDELESGAGRWSFESGAEVFWDDGEPAGKLVAAHAFVHPPSVDSDRRCFTHAGLRLCLRADGMKAITSDAGW